MVNISLSEIYRNIVWQLIDEVMTAHTPLLLISDWPFSTTLCSWCIHEGLCSGCSRKKRRDTIEKPFRDAVRERQRLHNAALALLDITNTSKLGIDFTYWSSVRVDRHACMAVEVLFESNLVNRARVRYSFEGLIDLRDVFR